MRNTRKGRGPARALLALAALFSIVAPNVLAASAPATPSAEALVMGERMYRNGILPSGERMRIQVKGDAPIPGTTFACAGCHLRSGVGSFEENVFTPAITAGKLFQPREFFFNPGYPVPARPAYTDASLVAAIREGIDAGGKPLNNIMPRFILKDEEANLLVAYLRSLSSRYSPGVTREEVRFATIVTDGVPAGERDALLEPLTQYLTVKNAQSKSLASRGGAPGQNMAPADVISRQILLSTWHLKGGAETWRSQLEEHYRKEPVFAILGGIAHGSWEPVHRFSEENAIPCLFPITDFPVISDHDWYTMYLSKGYYQEGEGAARYLDGDDHLRTKKVFQIIRNTPEGRALAAGFQRTWQDFGHKAPSTLTLKPGERLTRDHLEDVLEKGAVLLVWDDAQALSALEGIAGLPNRPDLLFLSSRYLGESIWSLPQEMREFTFITYPFAFSPPLARGGMGQAAVVGDRKTTTRQSEVPLKDRTQAISALAKGSGEFLSTVLVEMKDNFYRDALLDVIGTMMEQPFPLYGRISLGAGQRYGARGCYIVQLSEGANPQLVKKNGWEQ